MGHAVLASIQWDPEIRNILSLLVGIGVLMGSVYLLLATNLGARLGLLVALAALFGWLSTMGVVWWINGIGMQGAAAHWTVTEVNIGDIRQAGLAKATTLPPPSQREDPATILKQHPELKKVVIPAGQEGKIPTLGEFKDADPKILDQYHLRPSDLGGWTLLGQSDARRGDAVATSDAAIGADGKKLFTDTSQYKDLDVFQQGGKPRLDTSNGGPVKPSTIACKPRLIHPKLSGCWNRVQHKLLSIWHWQNPPSYAVVQLQKVIPVCADGVSSTATSPCVTVAPGGAPPPPQVDPKAPVISVIMIRDLGDKRFPAGMVTFVFTTLFVFTCYRLHVRDKLAMANRAAAAAGA